MSDKFFIRTKDEQIIEVEDTLFDDNGEMKYQYKNSSALIKKSNVIKQADTIEELCDEFVIIPNNNWSKNYLAYGVNTKKLKDSIYNLNYPIKEVYGAIWTDKGLIYVAKMNHAGKMELY